MTRSRRAGLSRDEVRQQPLYARMLGLQYLAPSGFLCFVFLEGAVALGILLALAELVSWWGVLVLPMMVAVMVKLNDVVAGALTRPAPPSSPGSPGAATVRLSPPGSPGAETVRLSPSAIAAVTRPGEAPALRPAAVWQPDAGMPGGPIGERRAPEAGVLGGPIGEHWALDAGALNGPPVSRAWAEHLDEREQRARQSAARRYE